jgi:hypothetical protein
MEIKKKIQIAAGIVSIFFLLFILGGGANKMADNQMSSIEIKVAQDAEKQYEIAKSGGDKMDIYVHAGMVAAAYLQAKDQANYNKWKAIEKEDARAVGL